MADGTYEISLSKNQNVGLYLLPICTMKMFWPRKVRCVWLEDHMKGVINDFNFCSFALLDQILYILFYKFSSSPPPSKIGACRGTQASCLQVMNFTVKPHPRPCIPVDSSNFCDYMLLFSQKAFLKTTVLYWSLSMLLEYMLIEHVLNCIEIILNILMSNGGYFDLVHIWCFHIFIFHLWLYFFVSMNWT